jgi:hypothetical protein
MSLFSFANISFGSQNRKVGTDSNLGAGASYGYNLYRYPIDLGSSDKGHYMMFHINKQTRSKITGNEVNEAPTVIQNRINFGIRSPASYALGLVTNNANKAVAFSRTIQRVSDNVALYMPDTLNFTNQQGYSDAGLTGMLAAGSSILSQGSSITDNLKGITEGDLAKRLPGIIGNLSPALATIVKEKSALLSAGLTAYTGAVINPMLEMIYSTPAFREFQFDFMLYPRSEKEAMEVQKIINRLYFHQAPEIEPEGEGFFLIPPSEFDILFYYNGAINPNIPQISTCVLTNINVNYAPNGFSAYEVQGEVRAQPGRTGMPVAIQLTLNFKETEIMTKKNFDPGNGSLSLSNETVQASRDLAKAGQVDNNNQGIY